MNVHQLIGRIFIDYLSRYSSLRRTPILGEMIHWLSHKILSSKKLVWTQVRSGEAQGLWFKVYPRTGSYYYQGTPEPEVQQLLREHLRSGMVFYDIGANIGFFTMIAARIVGPKGEVFAFEPEREAACRLKENAARNGFSNVRVVEAAAWHSSGSVGFVRCDPCVSTDRGMGKVVSSEANKEVVLVPSIKLDDFFATAVPPHFIKCDVEGAEAEVFEGAHELLAQHKPVIVCEIHSNQKIEVLRELFEKLGYNVHMLNANRLMAQALR